MFKKLVWISKPLRMKHIILSLSAKILWSSVYICTSFHEYILSCVFFSFCPGDSGRSNFRTNWNLGQACLFMLKTFSCRFGDLKLHIPENWAFAQMFQKTYAAKILECHLNLLNVIRVGGYLPDRVTNLILQYLSNRWFNFIPLNC